MTKMRMLAGLLGLTAALHAHPMGNFSVNHYARIEVTPRGTNILFVLDLAEIPTFELMQKWGMTKDSATGELQARARSEAQAWVRELRIRVDGKPVTPVFEGSELKLGDGAGNLPVAQIRSRLRVSGGGGKLEYEDRTYPDRTAGWKEVVVHAGAGASIESAQPGVSAEGEDKSKELTAYPQDATVAPPQDLKAVVNFRGGEKLASREIPSVAPSVEREPSPPEQPKPVSETARAPVGPVLPEREAMGTVKRGDFLSRTLQGKEIGWGLGLICVAVAFWFGALHALEPGHGKTMVAAYLVGERGTPKHAMLLGGMVTFTHTISVFFLGLVTLFLSRYVQADLLSKVLGVVSGLTIVWIGAMLLYRRVKTLRGAVEPHGGAPHSHPHGEAAHTHDGTPHTHVPEGEISVKSLMVLGASGGLVPCPSALVLLLSAISIGRTGFGLLLLVSFSLGLALVLIATGLVVLYTKNLFPRRKGSAPSAVFRLMPVVSAVVILIIGIVLTGNAAGVIPVVRFFG